MSGGSTHTPSRCLYDALGVPQDVTPDLLKKAYYKKALLLHPDKCVGGDVSEEEAKARFQEIQHAYDVLSDPRERKFYDEHRNQILCDGDSPTGSRLFNFMPFFRPGAFKGYGDDTSGFYAVYGGVFDGIFNADNYGAGEKAPLFGNSKSPYTTVKAFYSFWENFSTRLNFSWEDEWNYSDAANRRIRRAMEKENSRSRAEARRTYSSEVQHLTTWVKGMDKRVAAEKQRIQAEADARKKQTQLAKVERARQYQARKEAWILHQQNQEQVEDDILDTHGETQGPTPVLLAELDQDREEEREDLIFRCAVCKKDFRSSGQLEQHEKSKAHKKRLAKFEEDIMIEAMFDKDDLSADSQPPKDSPSDQECRWTPQFSTEEEKELEKERVGSYMNISSSSHQIRAEGGHSSDSSTSSDDELYRLASFKSRQNQAAIDDEPSSDEDGVSQANHNATQPMTIRTLTDQLLGVEIRSDAQVHAGVVAAKPKRRRASKTRESSVSTPCQEATFSCKVCGATFLSRSKLFDHLKTMNHAAPG